MTVLVSPAPRNPWTGGYLYNQRVLERAPVLRGEYVEPQALMAWLRACSTPVVLDSLYLGGEHSLHEAKAPLAFLLHYLPDDVDGVAQQRVQGHLACARGFIAPSAFMAKRISERLPGARVSVCTPGVERPSTQPRTQGPAPRIVCVAHVQRAKGIHLLVEALRRCSDLPWTCRVIGSLDDTSYVHALRAALATSPLESRVELVGALPPPSVACEIGDANLFVLPSLYESYGMVYAEAIASGVPVVAFHVGGVPEIVEHGHTGLLAPVGDVDALTEHVRALLTDLARRAAMSAACAERGARFPTWNDTASAFVRAVEQIFAP